MELKRRILDFLREKAKRPLLAEEIAEGMGLTDEEEVAFAPALEELERDAGIIRNRSDRYGLPSRMHLVVGRLSISAKGYGFIIPEERESEDETDVFVPVSQLGAAMHNDRVVARVTPSEEKGRSREGEVLRIVQRANERIVGTFERSRSFGFVTPDDTRLRQDVFVPKEGIRRAKTGSKVVVEVTRWPSGRHKLEGRIVEVLGQSGEPGVDILSIMRKYGMSEKFPGDVRQAAAEMAQAPSPEEYRGRRDRRDFRIVTVDGEDAKDLDDGVYAEKRKDGGYFLGVYIADVSHYVREGQPLDREAAERGTSVYLVDRVIPMLPKELSNGICSLNAGEDRLAMACEMQLDREGRVESYEIVPAVIHVYRRLTYHIVNLALADRDPAVMDDQADILPMLEHLAAIRDRRKALRKERGSIDFEIPEIKVRLDEEGHPAALLRREGSLAESIIEECMLAANETVAAHMERKHLPFLYRVHEQPGAEKIEQLNRLLGTMGISMRPREGELHPKDVQRALEAVQGRPEERIVSMVALRSMQQARYSAENLGHFGLAARHYTHFTSPIRRYPDLVVHRLLRETLREGTMPLASQERFRGILPGIAEHSSAQERRAVEAERETTDLKKIEYMARFVGDEFDGVISGVTAFGMFVELENGVEGLVHVSTLVDDYYAYAEERYALVGEGQRRSYRLGDEVAVVVLRANLAERNLDFVLRDNSPYSPADFAALREHRGDQPSLAPRRGKGRKKPSGAARGRRSRSGKPLPADDIIASVESHGRERRHEVRGTQKKKTISPRRKFSSRKRGKRK